MLDDILNIRVRALLLCCVGHRNEPFPVFVIQTRHLHHFSDKTTQE